MGGYRVWTKDGEIGSEHEETTLEENFQSAGAGCEVLSHAGEQGQASRQ